MRVAQSVAEILSKPVVLEVESGQVLRPRHFAIV